MKDPMKYLEKDFLLHADMINALRDEDTKTFYSEDDGVLLRKPYIWFMTASSAEAAAKMAKLINGEGNIVVHQFPYVANVLDIVGEEAYEVLPCRQCCYLGKEPLPVPETPGYTFRMMRADELDFVCKNYSHCGDDVEYMKTRLEKGIIGAYKDGKCAGFIGEHAEGAIGILEVLPEYRRQGLGYALEVMMVNKKVSEGHIPFDHVIIGNDVSMSLQAKIGMTFSDGMVTWLIQK